MQGQGLIRFFLIFMLIISVYTFALFIPTNGIENRAESYAASMTANMPDGSEKNYELRKYQHQYLDSMSRETVLNLGIAKFNYLDLKGQQLALGLDLKGGMSVVMQVDLKDLVVQLADNSQDPNFLRALSEASKNLSVAQEDYITLFSDAFESVAPGQKLAPLFQNNLKDDITFDASNSEVASVLRAKANETVELTYNRLKQRIDKFGVTQPNVTLDPNTDRIMVELPGIDNPERARNFLQATAKLEFFDVYLPSEIMSRLQKGDNKLKERQKIAQEAAGNETDTLKDVATIDSTSTIDSNDIAAIDTTSTPKEETVSSFGPLFAKLSPNPYNQSCLIGSALVSDTSSINKTLKSPEFNLPKDLRFLWSNREDTDEKGEATGRISLYAIKTIGGKAPLEGDVITDARADLDQQTNAFTVSVNMNNTGRQVWSRMTTAAAPTKRQVAIALDNEIVSAPAVQSAINGGSTQITGNFSAQEAEDLAKILQVGKLPAKTQIIEENIVGPSLGQDNINSSLIAITIGFVIVLAFMMVYYGTGGIISIMALLLNLIFIFASLGQLGTVLTLPGFAGVILTIGMAVDANVIIFERIREELREGKTMLLAIQNGFQASYSAIIDANVTTILTGIVLYYFGLGPIKGFAAILIIGVICSLFTAVLVGRLLIEWWIKKGWPMSFNTKFSANAFSNMNIDFVSMRKKSYIISGSVILAGLISFFALGFQLGVDFKGGRSFAVHFDQPVQVDNIRSVMTTAFGEEPVVKSFGTNNTYEITTSYMVGSGEEDADKIVLGKLFEGVASLAGAEKGLTLEAFEQGKSKTQLTRSIKVGATIADDIRSSAFYAAIFALLLIFLYIFVRFRKWQYSAGAVAALFHDVLIVLSIFSIGQLFLPFSLEINQVFIGAILTVIGYSINDTVIVFDRIREFINAYTRKPKHELFNLAINNTISRTLITSLTTIFMVLILFLFGGSSITGFAFALVVGIVVGTYSSIFIATPIVYDLTGELEVKEAGKTTKYGNREKSVKEEA